MRPSWLAGSGQEQTLGATMTVENPTGDAGASISERIETFLAGQTSEEQPKEQRQAEPEKAVEVETPETAEEAPADDEQQADEPQISLTDLAKYLGVDESTLDIDEDGGVKVKTKIDGKEGAAKFHDLVKSYQLQGHVDAKAREAAETQKALSERVQQFEAFAQTETQRLTQLAQMAQAELAGDIQSVNWQELARNDPAEYVAKQAEFNQRQGRVNQLMGEVQQRNQQVEQSRNARMEQAAQHVATYLETNVEGWKAGNDVDKALQEYAVKSGIQNTRDVLLHVPSVAVLLNKAMLYDQGKAKSAVVEKQVRAAPKLVKPGQSVDAKQRAEESTRSLKENIRKSGGKKGIAEYLMATGRA